MERVHYWSARYVKDAPLIGVKTFLAPPYIDGEFLDRSPRWQALIHTETTARVILMGEPCPIEVEGAYIRNIEPTTQKNYEHLVKHSAWSATWMPSNPDASPKKAVNFHTLKPF